MFNTLKYFYKLQQIWFDLIIGSLNKIKDYLRSLASHISKTCRIYFLLYFEQESKLSNSQEFDDSYADHSDLRCPLKVGWGSSTFIQNLHFSWILISHTLFIRSVINPILVYWFPTFIVNCSWPDGQFTQALLAQMT